MANCVMCSLPVPDGQRTCSMCYGDVDHGKDGYYRDFLERQHREEESDDAEGRREMSELAREWAERIARVTGLDQILEPERCVERPPARNPSPPSEAWAGSRQHPYHRWTERGIACRPSEGEGVGTGNPLRARRS